MDDDTDDRVIIEDALGRGHSKYKIIAAADGIEALERIDELKARGELPCLVILDVNMPRMDGRDTLERLRADEQTRRIPVVIFSTADTEHQQDFYSAYGVQYFAKPIDYDRFCTIVQRFLSVCEHAGTE